MCGQRWRGCHHRHAWRWRHRRWCVLTCRGRTGRQRWLAANGRRRWLRSFRNRRGRLWGRLAIIRCPRRRIGVPSSGLGCKVLSPRCRVRIGTGVVRCLLGLRRTIVWGCGVRRSVWLCRRVRRGWRTRSTTCTFARHRGGQPAVHQIQGSRTRQEAHTRNAWQSPPDALDARSFPTLADLLLQDLISYCELTQLTHGRRCRKPI